MSTDSATADERLDGVDGLGLVAAAVAVSAWGLSGVVAKEIAMGAMAIGAYRFGIYGLTMLIVGFNTGARIDLAAMRASFWGGIALGADIALFFSAVKLTTIVNATIIGALQPVIVSVVANRVFGESITKRDIQLGGVAIVGVVVVALGSTGRPEWNLAGDLCAVGALFAWSAYFVANRLAKDSGASPRQYLANPDRIHLGAGVANTRPVAQKGVIPLPSANKVVALAANDGVVAVTSTKPIVAGVTGDLIVPCATADAVPSWATQQSIVLEAPNDGVVTRAAVDTGWLSH